jgi:tetratricopeptide (TPR) repeat protein
MRAAQYYWETGNGTRADAHFQRAIALNPDHPLVLGAASTTAVYEGDLDQAVELMRRALAHDPLSAVNRVNLGVHLIAIGERREARMHLEKALELSSKIEIHGDLARLLVLERQLDRALAHASRLPQGAWRDHCLALVHHAMGRQVESEAALARLIVAAKPGSTPENELRIAEVYAFRGDLKEARRWLATAERNTRRGGEVIPDLWLTSEIRLSPFLTPLHSDRRWQARSLPP